MRNDAQANLCMEGAPGKNVFEEFRCGGGTRTAEPDPQAGTGKRERSSGSGSGSAEGRASKVQKRLKDSQDESAAGLPEKLGDAPLRLVIVGHNPSAHAWKSGHYYSNPSNRMWKILKSSKIAPDFVSGARDDDKMLSEAGVGFTDVGTGHPGTVSSEFSSNCFVAWRKDFFSRLKAHVDRASSSIGCVCGLCGCPKYVAFAGKRHFLELFNAGVSPVNRIKSVEIGKQHCLPKGWPLPPQTEVWVLPSTSGASALTNEQREAPFLSLASKLVDIEWPRKISVICGAEDVPDGKN